MEEISEKLIQKCLDDGTEDPMENFRRLTSVEGVPMHGPLHHMIVPMSLITAIWNSRKDFELRPALELAAERMSAVPGARCGNLGVCGAAIGTGATSCIINNTSPMSHGEVWGNNIAMTSAALNDIAAVGGPRCCKRDSALAIEAACRRSEETFGTKLECSDFVCDRMKDNAVCIGKKCPFNPHHGE